MRPGPPVAATRRFASWVKLYELLVLKRGWSLPRFAAFLADFMIAALLPRDPGTGA
jgi:hypothetical protein